VLDWPWTLAEVDEALPIRSVLDWLAAFVLTFATARYGLVAVYGMVPWLLVRDRQQPWPWGSFVAADTSRT
jgi:hypothetical protein